MSVGDDLFVRMEDVETGALQYYPIAMQMHCQMPV